jgi:hypothetical protein
LFFIIIISVDFVVVIIIRGWVLQGLGWSTRPIGGNDNPRRQ